MEQQQQRSRKERHGTVSASYCCGTFHMNKRKFSVSSQTLCVVSIWTVNEWTSKWGSEWMNDCYVELLLQSRTFSHTRTTCCLKLNENKSVEHLIKLFSQSFFRFIIHRVFNMFLMLYFVFFPRQKKLTPFILTHSIKMFKIQANSKDKNWATEILKYWNEKAN